MKTLAPSRKKSKSDFSESIARLTQEFLCLGKSIQQIPYGYRSINYPVSKYWVEG